jgi:hypothetical protein
MKIQTFTGLLRANKFEEIAMRAVRIESRTNLIFSFEKMALRDAVSRYPIISLGAGVGRVSRLNRVNPESASALLIDDFYQPIKIDRLPKITTDSLKWCCL